MAKRVYFAFDYEDVADFRANVVRNHKFAEGVEKAGYFDASIWEESKRKDDATLKRLINGALDNTTVTAVLIGSDTYARRWVRYEIIKSIQRGNALVGIHINGIAGKAGKHEQAKALGPNPMEYVGLQITSDGKSGNPVEWDGHKWISSKDADSYKFKNERAAADRGNIIQISRWSKTYDWVKDDGYESFKTWIA
jgi:hypothetical protein